MIFNKMTGDSKQRFGIRKLSIGVCSVLLSTLFLTINESSVVHADDVKSSGNPPEEDHDEQARQTEKSGSGVDTVHLAQLVEQQETARAAQATLGENKVAVAVASNETTSATQGSSLPSNPEKESASAGETGTQATKPNVAKKETTQPKRSDSTTGEETKDKDNQSTPASKDTETPASEEGTKTLTGDTTNAKKDQSTTQSDSQTNKEQPAKKDTTENKEQVERTPAKKLPVPVMPHADSNENAAPVAWTDDNAYVVVDTNLTNLASKFLQNGAELEAAGAKITWVGDVPKPTQADIDSLQSISGKVRVQYANGTSKEVEVSAMVEPHATITSNTFYYVNEVGDRIDSATVADANGRKLWNQDDSSKSVLNTQNLYVPGSATAKLLAPLDTSTIGIHWAEVQVTDTSVFTNGEGTVSQQVIGTPYIVKLPYVVKTLKLKDDIPMANGDPTINAQLATTLGEDRQLAFNPTNGANTTMGEYFYQDYALAVALGISTNVSNWTAPTDLKNTKENHFTLSLTQLPNAPEQNIQVKYISDIQVDPIYIYNAEGKNYTSGLRPNSDLIKQLIADGDMNGQVHIILPDGTKLKATDLSNLSAINGNSLLNRRQGIFKATFTVGYNGLNKAGQPNVFTGVGNIKALPGFNDQVNEWYAKLNNDVGSHAAYQEGMHAQWTNVSATITPLQPSITQDTPDVVDISDGPIMEADNRVLSKLVKNPTETQSGYGVAKPNQFTDANGKELPKGQWPDGTKFEWAGKDGAKKLVLDKAGETRTGDVKITLPSGSTYTVKNITVVSRAQVKLKNETVDYGTKLTAKDLVTNTNVFPKGTTFQFTANEPEWTKPGTYNTVTITATYPTVDENGKPITGKNATITTDPAKCNVAINGLRTITVLEGTTDIPSASSVLNLPTDWAKHDTPEWVTTPNSTQTNEGEIKVHYTESGLDQTIKVCVNVIPRTSLSNVKNFYTNGNRYDGQTGSIANGENQGGILTQANGDAINYQAYTASGQSGKVSTITKGDASYTPTYSLSGLQTNTDGILASGQQNVTIKVYVPKGTIGVKADDQGSYYELTDTVNVAQKVKFQFVDQYHNDAPIENIPTYSQEFIPGVQANLNFRMQVPNGYELASNTSIPTSYKLAAFTKDPITVDVPVHQKMHFYITFHDEDSKKDLGTVEVSGSTAGNGGYDPNVVSQLNFPKDVNQNDYISVSTSGVPEGVILAGDQWDSLTDPGTTWYIPNYKWTNNLKTNAALCGATMTINLKHRTQVTQEQQTRQIIVNYVKAKVNADGTYTQDGNAFDPAKLDVYYSRTATKDLVTKKTTYTPWLWDQAKNADGFVNGYKVVSGNWTSLPQEWGAVVANVPTLAGYTVAKVTDKSGKPANEFVYPSWNNSDGTTSDVGKESLAYTTNAPVYEAQPVHTVLYIPNEVQPRTITAHFKIAGGERDGQDFAPDAQVQVFYQRTGTLNVNTNKITYGNWAWDRSAGDKVTPGFHVISGSWNLSGSGIVVNPPASGADYVVPTIRYDGSFTTVNFSVPTYDVFKNNTDPTWYNRNELTTYYVPKSMVNETVTRTITINEPGKEPQTITQPVNLSRPVKVNADDTGVVYEGFDGSGWTTGNWVAQDVPAPDGYRITATQTVDGQSKTIELVNGQIPAEAVNGTTKNTTINVTYQAIATAKLTGNGSSTYNGKTISIADLSNRDTGIKVVITGPTASSGTYSLQAGDVEFSTDGGNTWTKDMPINADTYQVQLTKQGKDNIKSHFGNNSISWTKNGNSTVTSNAKYTINPSANVVSVSGTQTEIYKGSAYGVNYNTNGNNSVTVSISRAADNQNGALASPTGVTLDSGDFKIVNAAGKGTQAINANGTYHIVLTDDGLSKIQDKLGKNYSITQANDSFGTLQINKATATVKFAQGSGQTVNYDGKTDQFDAGKFTPIISTNNDQALTLPSGVTLSVAAGDFTFNNVAATSEPTDLGQYTIGLSGKGFAKLQSATNNYDWVNQASAVYKIQKANGIKVTLNNVNGGQSEVYKNAAYGNNNIDVHDYSITLGNGKAYTLQAGDLEFAPNQDPTNANTYQVVLSQQGKDNISKLDPTHYSYDVDTAGYGEFTITKATPTVVFNGVGEKVYNGQPISNYTTSIGVTITAPSDPTINLGSGDYEFVAQDGTVYATAPVNVGTYTIRLTQAGRNKITGNSTNAANLDWVKASISGTGSYKITRATATATLKGQNYRDYNGSAVSPADLYAGTNGNITVTIAIPNSDRTISYTLKADDYTWDTTGHAAPINQGTYTFQLNKDKVLAGLKAAIASDPTWKGNVVISTADLTGSAQFTINQRASSVSLKGSESVTYNGKQAETPLEQLKHKISATNLVGHDDQIDLSGLTASDFDWYKGTTKLNKAPTDHGTYTIKLNAAGLTALQGKNKNYKLSINDQQNEYSYVINTAKGTITLANTHRITFGDSDPDYYKNYQLTLGTTTTVDGFTPSYTLQAGDLQFSTDGSNWSTSAPTGVGEYQVSLSQAGFDHIKDANGENGNVIWPATYSEIKDTAKYVINAATASAELGGNATMKYDGQPAEPSDLNGNGSTIKVTVTIPGKTGEHDYTLQAGDYTWDAGSTPVNVGKNAYKLSFNLSDTGKTHLKAFIDGIAGKGLNDVSNVNIPTAVSGNAYLTITPVAITVTQGGSGDKTYNSQPAAVSVDTVKDALSASGLIGEQSFKTDGLTAADFDWYKGNDDLGKLSDAHVAPTDAGDYTIKLNADGLKALQDANSNYSFDAVAKAYSYKINQANATISLNPTANTQNATWNGSGIDLDLGKFVPKITTDNENQATIAVPDTLHLAAGDYTITQNGQTASPIEPGKYQVTLTKHGWQKVRDAISGNANYKWTSTGNGTLEIGKATATVTLNGPASVTYTGEPAQIPYDGQYTVTLSNGKTYTLQSGDLEFTGADPTNVGSCTVKLSQAGLQHIQAAADTDGAHYTYSSAENTADLNVTPAQATATISGQGSHEYNGSAASLSEGHYTITLSNGMHYDLKSGDYNFVDDQGNVINAPINFGSYKIGLTTQGKKAIEDLTKVGTKNNYDWTFNNSNATFGVIVQKMAIIVKGGASKHYDGDDAVITADDIRNGRISLRWGNAASAPDGVHFTLSADDFEVVNAAGQRVKIANVKAGTETADPIYYIKLKDSALNRIQQQTNNYKFTLGQTNAFYKIYARKAALTVSGTQVVNYGSPEKLDWNKYQVTLSNWAAKDGQEPTITLDDRDLQIVLNGKPAYGADAGGHAGLPINVGNYTVEITNRLRKWLEDTYTNYDFGVVGHTGTPSTEAKALDDDAIEPEHKPAEYIVQPRQVQVTIDGSQSVKYGSANYNKQLIINVGGDHPSYKLSYGNIASRDQTAFNNFKLKAGDLTFATTPGEVGEYQVKLTRDGIANLKAALGANASNYDWSVNVENARGKFEVVQMPVTITVANKSTGQSVVYGQPMTINPNDYQVTIKTENGTLLNGWAPSEGDLQFDGPTPVNVGDQYKVILSGTGLQSIENKFGTKNYSYNVEGNGNFKVTPAEATITLTGGDSKIYNGKLASPTAGKYTLTLTNGFTYNLKNGDLVVTLINGSSSDANNYKVTIKQSVLDTIKAQDGNGGKNYSWTVNEDATYDITKATATVSFENAHNSQTESYKGTSQLFNPADFKPTISTDNGLSLTVSNGIRLSVADGDFEFVPAGKNTGSRAEPVDAGTYTVKLTKNGLDKISNHNTANYDWINSTNGTYTINPIQITVSGHGSETATYDGTSYGNKAGLNLNQFEPTLAANGVAVPSIPNDALTASDYTIKQNDQKVTAPTKAGSYDIYLNDSGLKKLAKLSTNFIWPTATEVKVGTFTIDQTTASAALSGDNHRNYNGAAVTTDDLNNGGDIHVTITVKVGNDNKTFTYHLQDNDYTWNSGSTPVNVSDTPCKLVLNNDVVLAHLQNYIDSKDSSLKGNYKLTADNLSGSATFTINKKEIDVTQAGSVTRPYDGSPASVTLQQLLGNLTADGMVNNQTLNTAGLTLGDFTWSGPDDSYIAKGDYTISLTPDGIDKLQNNNPNYSFTPTGSFTYKITAGDAYAALSGHGQMKFDGSSVTDSQLSQADPAYPNDTIKVTFTIPGESNPTSLDLSVNDFDWNGKADVPTDAGTYTLTLNKTGKDAIKAHFANNSNIQWIDNSFSGSATYTISKADGTIVLAGSDSRVFNNKETTNLDGSKYSITINGVKHDLSARQYEIVDADGHKATVKNAGTYYVVLTDNSLTKDKNYNWTITPNGTQRPNQIGTYIITPASQVVIHYRDVNNVTTPASDWTDTTGIALDHNQTVDGTPGNSFSFDNVSGKWNYADAHYVLAGQSGLGEFPTSGTLSSDGNYYVGNYYVYLKHDTATVDPTKPDTNPKPDDKDWFKENGLVKDVTRTINYDGLTDDQLNQIPDEQKKQTVELTRTAKCDLVTGKIISGSEGTWTANGSDQFTSFPPKEFKGLEADKVVPAEMVTAESKDSSITVTYTPIPPAEQGKQLVQYVDADEGGRIIITKVVSGTEGSTINFTPQIPDNYEATGKMPSTITIAGGTTTIALKHKTQDVSDTKTITRTIVDELPSGTKTTTQTATITHKGTLDLVTNVTTWKPWTTGTFDEYIPDVPAGYTASVSDVPEETVTDKTQDSTVKITYTEIPQPKQGQQVIHYVDDDEGDKLIGTQVVKGTQNSEVNFNPEIPANYEPAEEDGVPKKVTILGNTTTIHLKHKTTDTSQTKDVTRTIIETFPSGATETQTQTATLTETGTKDLVTGKTKWNNDWIKGEWNAFTPDIVPGYTADPTSVAAATVTSETKDVTVEIKYIPNAQTGQIIYQDPEGKEVGASPLQGKTDEQVTVNPVVPDGWEIVPGQNIPKTVTATADGIPTVIVKVERIVPNPPGPEPGGGGDKPGPEPGPGPTPTPEPNPEPTPTPTPKPKPKPTPEPKPTPKPKPAPDFTKPETVKVKTKQTAKLPEGKPVIKGYERRNSPLHEDFVAPNRSRDEKVSPKGANTATPEGVADADARNVAAGKAAVTEVEGKANEAKAESLPQTGEQNSAAGLVGVLAAILGFFGLAGPKKKKDE